MFIGSLTTALAFLGFLFAQMKGFSQMGVISAIGIFLALLSQLMVTPALIAWADHKRSHVPQKDLGFGFMRPVGRFVSKFRLLVVALTIAAVAITFTNVKSTEVDGDVSSLTPSDLPSTRWLDIVQAEFDYNPDDITMMANDLNQLAEFTSKLGQMGTVASFESVAAYLPEDRDLWESTLSLLPDVLTENYIGNNGKFLIKVVANGNVWDKDFMESLREDLFSLTTNVSGIPVLMNEFVIMMVDDTLRISIVAAVAIFIILLLMLRSFKYALFTMIPIISSLYLLLGVMPIFDLQLNILNIIALPLIIGIGVGGAVHVANRVKMSGDLSLTLMHTGKAVILSSVTTIFAFGSLMFSGYPGLIGLGLLVVLGLSISLVLNLTFLPSILEFGRRKEKVA